MFTNTDYDKLEQLMAESPENRALIQKLLNSQKETVSIISHEIRNPLTLVYSTLQLIESQHPEVLTFRHWDSMRSDIIYIKQLLEELSSYNNGSTLSVQKFNFREFMESLALSFAVTFVDSQVEFTSYIDPDLPYIHGDRIKLREVLLNLLRNASEAVGDTGSIHLDAICEKDSIIITIKDSGCGIPSEYLADIFHPFVTHKQGGTGLGLAIVKRTIDAHHGTITVDSEYGKGAVFTMRLPV